jgi:hypothetical protein
MWVVLVLAVRLEWLLPRRHSGMQKNRPEGRTQATYRPRPPELGCLLRLVGLLENVVARHRPIGLRRAPHDGTKNAMYSFLFGISSVLLIS